MIFFVFISFLPDFSRLHRQKSRSVLYNIVYTQALHIGFTIDPGDCFRICIPPASSSFSAFLSDSIYFRERHKPSEMLIFSVSHHPSKTFCAYESPSFPSSFHSGAGCCFHLLCWASPPPSQEAVQWITSSAPHRQLHMGFFVSAMKQAQVSPNLLKACFFS